MRHKVNSTLKFLKLLAFSFFLFPFSLSAQLVITPAVTNATCPSDTNGSISVSVTGGTLPYTYLWSPGGEASSLVTGLVPGTYAVNIKDNAGVDSTVSYEVGPSPMMNDSAGRIELPFCSNTGSIVLSITGGTGAYQYLWNTGANIVGITQLYAGEYYAVVTDANNCKATFNFSLAEVECFVSPEPYFTPNGDAWNDSWAIANAQFFPDARVIIFDRWGLRVYDHKGTYEPWDGKSFLGVPVPDGSYYYFFYQDKDDKQKASKQGSVIIVR